MDSRVDLMCLVAAISESFRRGSAHYYKASVRVHPQGFFLLEKERAAARVSFAL
jgi:hypothetical protein